MVEANWSSMGVFWSNVEVFVNFRCVAQSLAKLGWCVILACRSHERGIWVSREIKDDLEGNECGGSVELGPLLDLESMDSIRNFAKDIGTRPIHLLVNNAGVNYVEGMTAEGVPIVCQVNYVGPYLLTRLLAPNLIAARPSRIVNVSSVMHRFTSISDPRLFLRNPDDEMYRRSKLALVLFTHELQRRLMNHGVECHAVDPGAVHTAIFSNSLLSKFPFNRVLEFCYAPPEDGCQAVVHASTVKSLLPILKVPCEIEIDTSSGNISGGFFARGLFASRLVTYNWESTGVMGYLGSLGHKGVTFCLSLLDYPLRRLSGNRVQATTHNVESAGQSYDAALARELWDATAEIVDLPSSV